jgi:hypothetical protein
MIRISRIKYLQEAAEKATGQFCDRRCSYGALLACVEDHLTLNRPGQIQPRTPDTPSPQSTDILGYALLRIRGERHCCEYICRHERAVVTGMRSVRSDVFSDMCD